LLELANDPLLYVQLKAAENPLLPVRALCLLADHLDERIRRAVAKNPAAPPALLEQLLEDEGWHIPGLALKHPNISSLLLERYAVAPEQWFRMAVALNPSCSVTLLHRLSTDPLLEVLQAVLEHPNATEEIRAKARLCLTLEHGL